MSSPLIHWYPQWIQNCKESIYWIESGTVDQFCRFRDMPLWSQERKDAVIQKARSSIKRYESELFDVIQEGVK